MQATTSLYKAVVAGNELPCDFRVTVVLPLTRVNICPTPSFEFGVGAWTSVLNCAASQSSDIAKAGTYSLKIVWATAASGQFATFSVFLRGGTVYTLSAWVWVASGPAVKLVVSGIGSSATTTTTGGWERLTYTFTGGNATTIVGVIAAAATTSGQVCYVDAVLLEADTSTVGTYFDGSTAGAGWSGASGLSTSFLNIDPYIDFTPTVELITVARQLVTDMPDGTRLIAGYPTATADLTLSGIVDPTDETKTIAWLLNPEDTSSPLYRVPALGASVRVDAGVYTTTGLEVVCLFTGTIDDLELDAETGQVKITALDYRQKVRTTPKLPSFAARAYSGTDIGAYRTYLNNANPLLTSLWLIRYILAANGIYSNPQPRPGCVLYASLHASAWPEVSYPSPLGFDGYGSVDFNADGTPPDMVTGWWSPQVCGNSPRPGARTVISGGVPAAISTLGTGASWYSEAWVYVPASGTGTILTFSVLCYGGSGMASLYDWLDMNLKGSAAGLSVQFDMARASSSFGADAHNTQWLPAGIGAVSQGWHQFAGHINYTGATTAAVKWWLDGTLKQSATVTVSAPGYSVVGNSANISCYTACDTVQLTSGETAPVPTSGFVPSAYLDGSYNWLTAVPDVASNGDVWGVLQQIADAEAGIIGFDELGTVRFTNRRNLSIAALTATGPVTYTSTAAAARTIDARTSLIALTQQLTAASQANHIVCPVNALQLQKPDFVWTAADPVFVPAGGSVTLYASTSDIAVNVASSDGGYWPAGGYTGGATRGLTYWRAAQTKDGQGQVQYSITVQATSISPTQIKVVITNFNAFGVWMVNPDLGGSSNVGDPTIYVGGNLVTKVAGGIDGAGQASSGVVVDTQWPPLADGGAVTNRVGEKALTLPDNPFRQDTTSAQAFINDLLGDMYLPRTFWRNVAIVADPSLQLADRVTISDPDTSKIVGDGVAIGITTTIGRNDWEQNLDIRAVSTPGGWIMGQTGRSEMGVNTYT